MHALLLAAGYGTRLGAMGRKTPKVLLAVPGLQRPLADVLLDEVTAIAGMREVWMVTNRRFVTKLEGWMEEARLRSPVPLHLLCNGTEGPEERLGAVGDLAFALERMDVPGELLVAATDTILPFPLSRFVQEGVRRPQAHVLIPVLEEAPERLHRRGVVVLGEGDEITEFHEKPTDPPSTTTALPLYLFRPSALTEVFRYLQEGGEPDELGKLAEWLVPRVRVEGWRASGKRLDLGDPSHWEGETDSGF